jgi:hypothetical protein
MTNTHRDLTRDAEQEGNELLSALAGTVEANLGST